MSRQYSSLSAFRFCLPVLLIAGTCMVPGCTPAMQKFSPSNLWHGMQPHQLQKLNRGEGLATDAYFSVTDPIPERHADMTPVVDLDKLKSR